MEESLEDDKEYKETLRPLFNEYNDKLNQFDEDEIKSHYQEYNRLKNELKDIDSKIQIVEAKEKAALHHFKESDKYKYDPDCEYCIENGKEQINEQKDIEIVEKILKIGN